MAIDNLKAISEEASKAAEADMKKLVGQNVRLSIKNFSVGDIMGIKPKLNKETMVVGVYLPITGDIPGTSVLVFQLEDANVMADLLVRRPPGTTQSLTELDKSALKEVGNVIGCSYAASLSKALETEMTENPPDLTISMFGAVLEQGMTDFAQRTPEALMVEIEFGFEPATIVGYYYLLFGAQEIKAIMGALDE